MTELRVTINIDSHLEWQTKNLEHIRYEYDLKPEETVLDIGAYRGEWAREIHKRYGSKMICIEPTPYMDFRECEWIQAAASDHEGIMNFGGAYYYSSAHEEPTHSYPCIDINKVLLRHAEIALCKINIEGDEYSVLSRILSANLHLRIREFQIQFHEIQDKPYREWYKAIVIELSQSHRLDWRYEFCWENWSKRD